jgi:hypothetical protein
MENERLTRHFVWQSESRYHGVLMLRQPIVSAGVVFGMLVAYAFSADEAKDLLMPHPG